MAGNRQADISVHVSEPFFREKMRDFKERKREDIQKRKEEFVSLITTFQGFKKALNLMGFNSEQWMSQNCVHHFAGNVSCP